MKASYLGSEVLGAEVLEVLDGHLAVAVAVQDLQVALDVRARGREHAVERLVGVHDHRHHLDAVDHSVPVAVVGVQDAPRHVLRPLAVSQPGVDEDGVVALRARDRGVARLLVAVARWLHQLI